jgi:serine/threonine protein phosphatase PrpC
MDFSQADQKVSPKPDIYTWGARAGEVLILACDGVFDVMSNEDLGAFVTEHIKTCKGDLGDVSTKVRCGFFCCC